MDNSTLWSLLSLLYFVGWGVSLLGAPDIFFRLYPYRPGWKYAMVYYVVTIVLSVTLLGLVARMVLLAYDEKHRQE